MSRFAIKYPFLIIVMCLVIAIVGTVALVRMPVDLFPPINIPVVVIATFYSGMPPQQIETNITNPFERWFTLASGVDHIESRSLPGVSLIRSIFSLAQTLTRTSVRFRISPWRIFAAFPPELFLRSCSSLTPPACPSA